MSYGIPKQDGSGRGARMNFNRGGCCGPNLGSLGSDTTTAAPKTEFKLWHGIALLITAIGAIIVCKKV